LIEEEILYPALRDVDSEIVAESFEEHGVVEQLLDELAILELGEEQFDAKFKVMQENVEHHVEEEETQMFPKVEKLKNYDQIGLQLIDRKMQLMQELRGTESEDRAGNGTAPATMKASEKSEAVLDGAGASTPPPAADQKKQAARSRRTERAKATSGRGARSKQKAK
jgi:hemerythrin superfamily protein